MGSEQQGFWELRRQPRALLGTEAKHIKKDTAHVGLLGRRVEGVGEGVAEGTSTPLVKGFPVSTAVAPF